MKPRTSRYSAVHFVVALSVFVVEVVDSIGGKGFKFRNPNVVYNQNAAARTRAEFEASNAWVRPEFISFVAVLSILAFCFVWRRICSNIADPEMVMNELELDDTPMERFDGIEFTLFNRIRDPFNYAPAPTLAVSEEELDAMEKRAGDMDDIRDAAELLKMKNIRESVNNDIEKGQVFASVADQGSPSYAQKLSKFDDDVYDADWKSRNEKEKDGKHQRLHFKTDNQKAADKERELMGTGKAGDESDVFRSRKKKDDDYGAPEKKPVEKEAGEKEEGKKSGKEKSGWDAWGEYQNKGGADDGDDDDDSAYEINPVEQVGLSSRNTGKGATEHKEGSYHVNAMLSAVSPGEEAGDGKLAPPPNQGGKKEDPRFSSRSSSTSTTRKTGGYKAPTLAARPGTGQGGQNGQFSGRAPPPRTQDNVNTQVVPSTANIKAAGGSFSHGSGPLARQDTARALDGSTALSVKISPEKQRSSALQLDLSKVNTPPTSVKPPTMASPGKAPNQHGSPGNKKPLPQMSLATMTHALPGKRAGALPRPDRERPISGGSLDSGGGSGSGGQRVVDPSKVAVAPSGIPLPRPGSGSRPDSGNNSNRSSNNSSRDSTRSSISREEAKRLNATKGLTLSSFAKRAGGDDDDDGYSMDVRGEIDPLGTRGPPSRGGSPPARGAPPRMNPAVLQAVSAASQKSPGAPMARGAPPRFSPTGGAMGMGMAGSPPARGGAMMGPLGAGLAGRGPRAGMGRPPPGRPVGPPRGLVGPPPGAAPASARAPPRGPRPPPRGPLSGRKDE